MLFRVGVSDSARSSLRSMKRDYRALGAAVRDSGVQVVFSSGLLVKGKGIERDIQIFQVNRWLQGISLGAQIISY